MSTTQSDLFASAPEFIAAHAEPEGDGVTHTPEVVDADTPDTFFGFVPQTGYDGVPTSESLEGYRYDSQYDYPTKAFVAGEALLLLGPSGCGKSKYARFLAHKMGLPYHQEPHDAQKEREDIYGSWRPTVLDGTPTFVYKPGRLIDFYRSGGVYNADELTAAKQNTSHVYHPIANREVIYVETADGGVEEVFPHEHFRFIATSNGWNGYEGNYEMNGALFERFMPVEWDYLSKEIEQDVLSNDAPDVPMGVISDLVDFANKIRISFKASKGNQRYVLSTRVLRRMVRHMQRFDISLDAVVANHIEVPLKFKFPDEFDATMKIAREILPLEINADAA